MLNEHPRKLLQTIIVQYGRSICDNPKRCESILREHCSDYKRELNLLIAALKEKIPQELLKAPVYASPDLTLRLLSQRLNDNLGIAEDFALWAVESWALALNVIQQSLPKVQQLNNAMGVATVIVEPQPNWIEPNTGMEFVWIKSGSFMMGSHEDEVGRSSNERQHQVDIEQGFYLGKYLVTQAQWQQIMGVNPAYFKGNSRLPVEQVSWHDVQEFIQRLIYLTGEQYRLPTEAEWEYAARADTTTLFCTGKMISPNLANYDNHIGKTTAVGSYPANPWGLYDMAGNVWEWTCSIYSDNYDGSEQQCVGSNSNNDLQAVRGGSLYFYPKALRSASRYWLMPDNRGNDLGFRLHRTLASG